MIPTPDPTPSPKRLSIIYVEDELALRERYRRLMAADEHVVMVAGTCAEALTLLERHKHFDVAIVDWALPDCLGTAALADALKAAGVVVFVCSGFSVDTIPNGWRDDRYREIDFHQKPIYWPGLRSSLWRLREMLDEAREATPASGNRITKGKKSS